MCIRDRCGTVSRINGPNHNDLKYNGTDRYPMEFLKELSELQETYYPTDNIKWIGRHLEMDAGIWWRVIRNQIATFEEFREAFTQKYWGRNVMTTFGTTSNMGDSIGVDRLALYSTLSVFY